MFPIPLRTIALLSLIVLCAATPVRADSFLDVLDDVPVMPGLVEEAETAVAFESAAGRIVLAQASAPARPGLDAGAVLSFYRVSEGGYDSVGDRFFGRTRVNHFLLEFDTPRAGGFDPLRFVPKDKGVVLGLVSSKAPVLEGIDSLKRRAEEAAKYVDASRLAISPQCGFASTMGGNPVTEEDEKAKLRLCVEAAKAIWG